MNSFFSVDNIFFQTLSKICDLLFLSIVWILLCIPIITIGPASTAMYYSVVKVIRRERGYLFREFFKSFKLNFKRATIIGVILTVVFAVLAFDLLYAWGLVAANNSKGSLYLGVFLAITFIAICFSIYVFPILSRFEMTIRQLVKAASFMSMRHLPFTVLMALVTVATIVAVYLIPITMFIVPSASVFINSFMMERIFKRYMPQSEGPGEETGKDEWYLGN